jgi:hypothetical protein
VYIALAWSAFRNPQRTLDNFDFGFNPKVTRSLVFDLGTCAFVGKRVWQKA